MEKVLRQTVFHLNLLCFVIITDKYMHVIRKKIKALIKAFHLKLFKWCFMNTSLQKITHFQFRLNFMSSVISLYFCLVW